MSDPCRFEYPGKGILDITTLGRTDGTAAYADRIPPRQPDYKYSYNPCKPFSKGFYCTNVAVCQISTDGNYQYDLGNQGTALWNPSSEVGIAATITYTHNERTVFVKLQCSTTGKEEFEVLGEDPKNYYTFRLTHKCACWNSCSSPTSTTTTTTIVPPSINPCRFKYPGKGIIDLSFIGRTDEKAAYSDETTRTASDFKYSYNPCRSFSQGTDCIGVSVCQISKNEKHTFPLGTQGSVSWNVGSDLDTIPSINYSYKNKKVTVLLQCSIEGNNEFQAFGEDPKNNYKFQLTHKCACWNGCSSEPSTTTTATTSPMWIG
ncbi:hypothetical protein I4U23_016948 [Adineta vaga]|nr:hypothetical protein I4U23_016948 [Adineta vaga]